MASKVTVFMTAPASWRLPGDFSPVAEPPWNCNRSRHPNSGHMACPHFQRTRNDPVLPLTTLCRFWCGIWWSLHCVSSEGGAAFMVFWCSPGFQDFCKDLPMVSNQVITWYLKLISCNSASEELEEEQSIQNRGDTVQSETTCSHLGVRSCGHSCWFPAVQVIYLATRWRPLS